MGRNLIMRPITGEVLIGAPAETVFDFVADECHEPLYNRNMLRGEKLTPGTIGIGTRFAAVMRGLSRTTDHRIHRVQSPSDAELAQPDCWDGD